MKFCPDIMCTNGPGGVGSIAYLRLFGVFVRVPYCVMQGALNVQILLDNITTP